NAVWQAVATFAGVQAVGFAGSLLEQNPLHVSPAAHTWATFPVEQRVVPSAHTPLYTVPSHVSFEGIWMTPSPQMVHWSVVPGARHVLLSREGFPTQVGH